MLDAVTFHSTGRWCRYSNGPMLVTPGGCREQTDGAARSRSPWSPVHGHDSVFETEQKREPESNSCVQTMALPEEVNARADGNHYGRAEKGTLARVLESGGVPSLRGQRSRRSACTLPR